MDPNQDTSANGQPKGRSDELIALADDAQRNGELELALHLYCAAFEASKAEGKSSSWRAVRGLRNAWDLACELKDRSMAETIFDALGPFNTPDQNRAGTEKLQELAVGQLGEYGITEDDLKGVAKAVAGTDLTPLDADALTESLKDVFERMKSDKPAETPTPAPAHEPRHEQRNPLENQGGFPLFPFFGQGMMGQNSQQRQPDPPTLMYQDLAGYGKVLDVMKTYGFVTSGDTRYRSFVQATARRHGVDGLSLFEPFVFHGPSRDDCADFAEATAGEIGWPQVLLKVEVGEDGMGTIKLSGPFRRSFFGQPDLTDVPSPCTLIIENADLLSDLIQQMDSSYRRHDEYENPQRDVSAEIMNFIGTLLSKSDVFVILTTCKPDHILRPLREMLGPCQNILVELPDFEERCSVWRHLSKDHPSFAEFDYSQVADLCPGVSRRDLLVAGRAAVESAYRASLRSGSYQPVSAGDLLAELAPFVRDNPEVFDRLESAALEEFRRELNEEH